MTTPKLQLRTLYVLDGDGRIASTREPGTRRPPALVLIRGAETTAWAVRADVPTDAAREVDDLAPTEPPDVDLAAEPVHADKYRSLLEGELHGGPAFAFPDRIAPPTGVVPVDYPAPLERHFPDLIDELDARSPVLATLEGGHAVSACFCARRSEQAAEAGLQTAASHRGRGHAPRVTAAWALAIRASGRTPLYSTAWTNDASRAVARKLGLIAYASDWNVVDGNG